MQAKVHHRADEMVCGVAVSVERRYETGLVGQLRHDHVRLKWSVDRSRLFEPAAGHLHQVCF